MKIDLHVHIHRTSNCAKEEPEQMAVKAKELGLDGIVILDHHYYPNNDECKRAEDASGIKIFKGTELTVRTNRIYEDGRNGQNDIVVISPVPLKSVYGAYHHPVSEDLMPTLITELKDSGGFFFLAHPFRGGHPVYFDLDKYHPLGIEVSSQNTSLENRPKIIELINKYSLFPLSNSDAHKAKHLGAHYIDTDTDGSVIRNEVDLGYTISRGWYVPMELQMTSIDCFKNLV